MLTGRYFVAESREAVRQPVETSLAAVGGDVVSAHGDVETLARCLADLRSGGEVAAVLLGHVDEADAHGRDGASGGADSPLAAARRLRAEGYAGVVIGLGLEDRGDQDEDRPDFDDHVGLPVRPIELVHKLVTRTMEGSDASASSILFVEDHLDLASVQKLLLESRGHRVTVATDGHQAMEAVGHFTPDAVLMDMGLPGGASGADLLRSMKERPELQSCRFICTSGRQEAEVPWKEIGFDGFLRKPSSLDDIVETLTSEG